MVAVRATRKVYLRAEGAELGYYLSLVLLLRALFDLAAELAGRVLRL